ncbi:MAG: YbaB/EbfC family nucleoid-associated protein [Candidatus Rhabdochlamydia oedothoracis]|nr:YbaB/EbfC family nucleoid-associated protein [Candidatus Rhabdochlamydia oedothoracis]
MEQQIETMRHELQNKKVTGTSSANLVTVVLNGEKELLEINIKPECLDPNDPEGLQDLIKAACENAYQQLSSESSSLPFGF